jgi:outer membrane protein with beta-barrel domain
MKKAILAAGAVIFLSLSALGQETPKAEVFGGYSYFRGDGGANLHGWNASITGNLNRWFGVTADFSGHYNSGSSSLAINVPQVPLFTTSVDANTNIHNFLFGGTFSHRGGERLVPFAHALAGFSRTHVDGTSVITGLGGGTTTTSFSGSDTAFAAAFGGGLDVKLTKKFAFRVVQADYLLTRFGSGTQSNARISTGIVFRFGEK